MSSGKKVSAASLPIVGKIKQAPEKTVQALEDINIYRDEPQNTRRVVIDGMCSVYFVFQHRID